MENASKALLIVGGVLVALLVIGLCMYIFTTARGTMMTIEEKRIAAIKEEQTIKFMNYVGQNIYGSEVVNCVRRAMNFNELNPTDRIVVLVDGTIYNSLAQTIGTHILDTSERNKLFTGKVFTNADGTINRISFTR